MPCNPAEGRKQITRDYFVGMHSPYDLAHRIYMQERAESAKLQLGGTFHPGSKNGGKNLVAVNYYLNSPDEQTLEAEKQFIKDRAAYNLAEYHRAARAKQSAGR